MDSHRDLLHGGDRPAARGCRSRSVQTGSRLSYTCDTGAHRQVKVQTPPALRTAPPADEEKREVMMPSRNILGKYNSCNVKRTPKTSTCNKQHKKDTHNFLDSLSEFCLLLHHFPHFLEDGGGQFHVKTLWVGSHLAQQLLVGEDAVAVEASVMGHTLTTHG